MRRFWLGILVGVVLGAFLATTGVGLAAQSIRLVVNGKEVPSVPPPQMIGGRVFVPIRFVAEALGAKVEWDGRTQTVLISATSAISSTSKQTSEPTANNSSREASANQKYQQWLEKTTTLVQRVDGLLKEFKTVLESNVPPLEKRQKVEELISRLNPIVQEAEAIIPPPEKKETHDRLVESLQALKLAFVATSNALYLMFVGETLAVSDEGKSKLSLEIDKQTNIARNYMERFTAMLKAYAENR